MKLKNLFNEALKNTKNTKKYGKSPPKRKKIADTGYSHVIKVHCNTCKKGYTFQYSYWKNSKIKRITCIEIDKLEEKVKKLGLKWEIKNKNLVQKTLKEEGVTNDRQNI